MCRHIPCIHLDRQTDRQSGRLTDRQAGWLVAGLADIYNADTDTFFMLGIKNVSAFTI